MTTMDTTPDPVLVAMGERIRMLREFHDLTQEDLARIVDLKRASIANVEAGRQNIPAATLIRLAAALSTPVGALLGEVPLPTLPRITVTTVYVLDCTRCELREEYAHPRLADEQRRRHILEHRADAILTEAQRADAVRDHDA